jgi:hypothetical protein
MLLTVEAEGRTCAASHGHLSDCLWEAWHLNVPETGWRAVVVPVRPPQRLGAAEDSLSWAVRNCGSLGKPFEVHRGTWGRRSSWYREQVLEARGRQVSPSADEYTARPLRSRDPCGSTCALTGESVLLCVAGTLLGAGEAAMTAAQELPTGGEGDRVQRGLVVKYCLGIVKLKAC